MGNGMNKVLPGLYVGNYRDSKDQQQLDKFQITHIVAIHDSPRRLLPDKHYLCVMAADTPDQNLSQYFSVCNDFIHAARLREGNVLIHCLAGMSRSVTVAVAYIMSATNLNWKEALKVVRAGRAVANPNVGFQTQLQEFEMFRLADERRRLKERFPSTALEQSDRTKCVMALDNYQELLQNKDICEGNCSRGEKCPTGVCNMDPTKGLFRRRPSTASNRSRLHPQSSTQSAGGGIGSGASTSAQSCPSSPKHAPGNRRSLGEQRIPEDEEAPHLSPTTSTEASAYAAAVTAAAAAANQQRAQRPSSITTITATTTTTSTTTTATTTTSTTTTSTTTIPTTTSNAAQSKSPRISSAGSRLTGNATSTGTQRQQRQQQQQQKRSGVDVGDNQNDADKRNISDNKSGGGCTSGGTMTNLHRSASTISEFGVRPRSSPAGLHSYTGLASMPASVHGSRVDLRDTDKGSAIYLGCSAPRNSNWSISSRGSSGGSAPPTPVNTPPVSPRHGVRRL